MKVTTLGPEGTFSHEAVLSYDKNAEIIFVDTLGDVFEAIETGRVDYGIVPVENSIEGSVRPVLDLLREYNLKIKKEMSLPINHYLCSLGELEDITEVYSHPQALAQCRKFLNNLNITRQEKTDSTSRAAQLVSKSKDNKKAAICTKTAAELYSLKTLAEEIQDENSNETVFILLSTTDSEEPTGNDKTSLSFQVKNEPGSLYEVLKILNDNNINMTKIESRPNKRVLGEYIFFVDVDGHRKDEKINETLEVMSNAVQDFKIFGSYPKKR